MDEHTVTELYTDRADARTSNGHFIALRYRKRDIYQYHPLADCDAHCDANPDREFDAARNADENADRNTDRNRHSVTIESH